MDVQATPKLILEAGALVEEAREILLIGPELVIGRDPDVDVVIDAPIVSRFHAVVERVGQCVRVRDLNSANGTFANDAAVDGDTWLRVGDTTRVGRYLFVLGQGQLGRYDETGGLRVQLEAYQQARAEWVLKCNTAVSRAESLLGRFYDDFGRGFVDKDDTGEFVSRVLTAWGILARMIVALFAAILLVISRKP